MQLILANNQSERFTDFYRKLSAESQADFDYAGYRDLLFKFDKSLEVQILSTGRGLTDYEGVYITGYLPVYELAAAMAIVCDSAGIAYADHELHAAPSLSKLTMYAKLAAAGVNIPQTIGGAKQAFLQSENTIAELNFPFVLKRADAERGADNYLVHDLDELNQLLEPHDRKSLWVAQEFIANDGFYRVGVYGDEVKFCIFRSLEKRPDGNAQKAHMYKPKGGANACMIDLAEAPTEMLETCLDAAKAMDRQIAGVDCLYDRNSKQTTILEVNYNPQLVTIDTFKAERIDAMLDYLPKIKHKD